MGAEDSRKKLKKKKSTKKSKEEKVAKAMEEKKKKKRSHVLIRRRRDEQDELHLSNYKNESDNVDGEKKENKSTKRKRRKNVRHDETESLEIDQSNEREDGLSQEKNVSAEKRKSRKKNRKNEKRVRRNEANDDSDQQTEKDHSLSITWDNLVEKRGQAGEEEIDELSSGDEDCSKGMRKWVLDYYQSRPGLKVLQESIDEFITSYEAKKEQEKKEKEALAAEDGWTVVVHHKGRKKTTDSETGIAVGSVSQAAVMDNMDKKKKKDVGLDFYRFQKREAKRNEIMVLQSKFEQDKKRIQQLRAARKFRPY